MLNISQNYASARATTILTCTATDHLYVCNVPTCRKEYGKSVPVVIVKDYKDCIKTSLIRNQPIVETEGRSGLRRPSERG